MSNPRKKRSILVKFRNYFFTGVVVLIPIGITLYFTLFLINISSKFLPKEINPNHYLPYDIPGVEIIISVFLITLIGWLSLSFIGRKLLEILNNILKRIPILRTIYSALSQMTETFTKDEGGKKNVVLIEYPRKGMWAVGFATKDNTGEIASKTKKNRTLSKRSPEVSKILKSYIYQLCARLVNSETKEFLQLTKTSRNGHWIFKKNGLFSPKRLNLDKSM